MQPFFMPPPSADPLKQAILDRFKQAAQSPEGLFQYPTGEAGLRGLHYPSELTEALPEDVRRCFCGVGNPFLPGLPQPGDDVLDIGCGAGVDAIIAARVVQSGRVVGLDMSPEMLTRARHNADLAGTDNVEFVLSVGDTLPFEDASFDVLLSNGVLNLIVDKARILSEAFRVLRPGGRLQVADQIRIQEELSCPLVRDAASWAQ
jgi:SAM-dependent methyltransferase